MHITTQRSQKKKEKNMKNATSNQRVVKIGGNLYAGRQEFKLNLYHFSSFILGFVIFVPTSGGMTGIGEKFVPRFSSWSLPRTQKKDSEAFPAPPKIIARWIRAKRAVEIVLEVGLVDNYVSRVRPCFTSADKNDRNATNCKHKYMNPEWNFQIIPVKNLKKENIFAIRIDPWKKLKW